MKEAPQNLLPKQSSAGFAPVLRRAAYARAMGVDVWVARKKLAGVQSHLVVGDAVQVEEQNATLVRKTDQPVKQGGLSTDKVPRRSRAHQEVVSALMESDPAPLTATTERLSAAVSRPAAGLNKAVSFGAFDIFAKVMGELLLVDDMTQMQAANSAYASWLASVMQSVGMPGAIHLRSSDRLRWPEAMGGADAFRTQPVAQQRQQAQDLVSSWLLQKMQRAVSEKAPDKVRVSTVLLMGDVGATLLDDGYLGSLADDNRYWQLQVVRAPSSSQMWADPVAKQRFWQQLSQLGLSTR